MLFFTEYKATQALLMSALQRRYGNGCVTFINGDGWLEGVADARGQPQTMREDRRRAAERFNRGQVRFLVSTEAAGEGVDLQGSCSALIHVDLPWNPMRLHQRVGRLSRYGQAKPVDVISLRNPDTVESRIWECLDRKLDRITLAFQGAMDDPEDMRQLVIGMASPRMFTSMFADADPQLRGERLDHWFDSRTATFGGQDALATVRGLFGNVARFDFGEVAKEIPRVDLPDLVPFFKALLAVLNKRPVQTDDVRLSFKAPEAWRDDFRIADRYSLLFARQAQPQNDEEIAGVGHCVVNRAIRTAIELDDAIAAVPGLEQALVVYSVQDRITGGEGPVRRVIVGMLRTERAAWQLLRDWEVLRVLNSIASKPRSLTSQLSPRKGVDLPAILRDAEQALAGRLEQLALPFRVPAPECLACLLPAEPDRAMAAGQ
ncbi:MAG: SWF/SNF helicase family protein [Pirellulales bacterium]|nr:SWF/SNF helicase family protein [Pirellulales bacterium]